MSVIKIGIVEDEGVTSEVIRISLLKLKYKIATPAFNYAEAIEMFDNEKPDLVILDIKLGETNDGIDLAQLLKDKYHIPFIFLTANSDSATIERAKKVQPLAFLVKPFSQVDLHATIEIAFNNYHAAKNKQKNNMVMIKVGRAYEKINTQHILFLENHNHYFNIYFTKGETVTVRASTNEILELLPSNQFLQISRSYIVNVSHIQKIDSTTITIGKNILDFKAGLKEDILKMMSEHI